MLTDFFHLNLGHITIDSLLTIINLKYLFQKLHINFVSNNYNKLITMVEC